MLNSDERKRIVKSSHNKGENRHRPGAGQASRSTVENLRSSTYIEYRQEKVCLANETERIKHSGILKKPVLRDKSTMTDFVDEKHQVEGIRYSDQKHHGKLESSALKQKPSRTHPRLQKEHVMVKQPKPCERSIIIPHVDKKELMESVFDIAEDWSPTFYGFVCGVMVICVIFLIYFDEDQIIFYLSDKNNYCTRIIKSVACIFHLLVDGICHLLHTIGCLLTFLWKN